MLKEKRQVDPPSSSNLICCEERQGDARAQYCTIVADSSCVIIWVSVWQKGPTHFGHLIFPVQRWECSHSLPPGNGKDCAPTISLYDHLPCSSIAVFTWFKALILIRLLSVVKHLINKSTVSAPRLPMTCIMIGFAFQTVFRASKALAKGSWGWFCGPADGPLLVGWPWAGSVSGACILCTRLCAPLARHFSLGHCKSHTWRKRSELRCSESLSRGGRWTFFPSLHVFLQFVHPHIFCSSIHCTPGWLGRVGDV